MAKKIQSDKELGIKPRWFTGQEWANGTALRENQREFNAKNKTADPDTEPDWGGKCEVCGQSPTVPATGMCGPCTFGEAETVGGNW